LRVSTASVRSRGRGSRKPIHRATGRAGGWRPKLWPHQGLAIKLIERYLAARPKPTGSALIRMPTGTGKSGVIAVAAHHLAPKGHVLVLAPWEALVRQLLSDVQTRFWVRINMAAPRTQASRLLPSNAAAQLAAAAGNDRIFVSTVATLKDLQRGQPQVYAALARSLSLVLVDEGHYEPAPNWSLAVRGLGKPVVLLTATPYRNDLKYFVVDERFIYSYSHEEAERERFVRQVRFHEEEWTSAAAFSRQLIAFCRRTFDARPPRVIVRCAREETVRQITGALTARGASAVGIHERFAAGDGLMVRSVPDPDAPNGPEYWVHQFKLIEGIDNPDFRILAVYEPLGNERSFVQQVGRILRNPNRSGTEASWVFCKPGDNLTESWRAYRDFDRDARNQTYRSPAEIARSQPLQYCDRRFREPFDVDDPEVAHDFDYPRATQVFIFEAGTSLDELDQAIRKEWNEYDLSLGAGQIPDAHTRVIPYIAQRNSPLLLRKSFGEYALGFTIYRRVRGYLFYYDTHGFTPEALALVPRVEPSALARLYRGKQARLTSVSLRNTNLGRYDVRRRTLQAFAIDELAPDLGDQAHFASTATGFTEVAGRSLLNRYVGFTRGRIRDRVGGATPFEDYVQWIDALADELDTTHTPVRSVFERYAQVVSTPKDPRPENILLDFAPEGFRQARHLTKKPELLHITDLCLAVNPAGNAACEANGHAYELHVSWSAVTGTYHLDGGELNAAYENASSEPRAPSLLAFLNRTQAFRVIPRAARYTVYSRGRFYRPRVPLFGAVASDRFDLLRVLQAVPQLAAIASEKGDPGSVVGNGAGWAAGSLFHFIDTLGADTTLATDLATVELLVCDDLSTELADFIGLDQERRRVIAFHAKAFPVAKSLSASALHEVTAQALKNLGYLQPFFVGSPKNLARWDGPWRGGRIGVVNRRIRRGNATGTQAWERIRAALRDPDYSREVWLVLGHGLSKAALEQARSAPSPPAETIQIIYSLQSTWSSVSAVGARLRVLCSP
jgi:superfamily II DNA or RNA helicase